MEKHQTSPRHLLAALVGFLPLASSAGCPYVRGNEARGVDSPHGAHLAARDDAPTNFGQCSRKSNVAGGGTRSSDWWPCELRLDVLRQFSERADPFDSDFVYADEFAKLDVKQLKKDLIDLQTTSQDWWPADFGNYGPFFIRLSWHNAGTYRQVDGRGGAGQGQQRFAPLNSWPDNQNLDKARRLLWPIKQKYGQQLSWADLFVYAGTVALENMGFPVYGFAFGRPDTWQSDEGIYWGSEQVFFPSNSSNTGRYNGSTDIPGRSDKLESPLGAVDMGLIYVDPRGPNGIPNPADSALDIRETFGRMGMDDEETVALIAGGHAFGKAHGAADGSHIGADPNSADISMLGLGWQNDFGTGNADDAITSGLEVIWSTTPTKWSNEFFRSLLTNKWYLETSPGGAPQWIAKDAKANYPDPFIKGKFRKPTMFTSDLGLINDPSFKNISTTFHNDFKYFTEKFALAWYKLLHRDMGPIARYLGPEVPKEHFIWQDPLPKANYTSIGQGDLPGLKADILGTYGLNVSNLVTTAWGAASSFRHSDKRGGANGARIALSPQKTWASNNPTRLQTVLSGLKKVQDKFNSANVGKRVSLADLIILGGAAAIEKAAKDAGVSVTVPFTPGRVDTTQDLTDTKSFAYLEPQADGFRNYGQGNSRALTEEILVDKASLLTLTPPEMTVLVGGMRALNANYDGSSTGILTSSPGKLTNDFFVNLADISTTWSPISGSNNELFQGKDHSGKVKYTASRADLIFGSHPELRAITEVYGAGDGQSKFVKDFVAAWTKVSNLDRYDVFPSK